MTKQVISTDGAPAAIGPYSQAVVVDGWLWCSGQIPLHPETGAMVGGGDDAGAAQAQTERVLANLDAVLLAGGCTRADIVRCTVFLKDMEHFGAVNEIYAAYFDGVAPPARACVQAARLPRDVLVEIDAVAKVPNG